MKELHFTKVQQCIESIKETWFQLDKIHRASSSNTIHKVKDYTEIEIKFLEYLTEVNTIIMFYSLKQQDLQIISQLEIILKQLLIKIDKIRVLVWRNILFETIPLLTLQPFNTLMNLYLDLDAQKAIFELDLNHLFLEYLCNHNKSNFEELVDERSMGIMQDSKEILSTPQMTVQTHNQAENFIDRFMLVQKKIKQMGLRGEKILSSLTTEFESLLEAYSVRNKLDQLESIPNIFINEQVDNPIEIGQIPYASTEKTLELKALTKQTSLVDDIKTFNMATLKKDNLSDLDQMPEPVPNDDYFLVSVSKLKNHLMKKNGVTPQLGSLKATSLILSEIQYKMSKVRVWSELRPIIEKGICLVVQLLYDPLNVIQLCSQDYFETLNTVFNSILADCFEEAYQTSIRNIVQIHSIFSVVTATCQKLDIEQKKLMKYFTSKGHNLPFPKKLIFHPKIELFTGHLFKSLISDYGTKSKVVFQRYMITGKNSTVFNDLDLLNEGTEKEMMPLFTPVFKDLNFYRTFNKAMQNGLFVKSTLTKKQHYMTGFLKLLNKVEKQDTMALLWGVKIMTKEFTQIFTSRSKHCNFLGFMSLLMNLSSFLHLCKEYVGEKFYSEEVAKIEELRFLKQSVLKIFHDMVNSQNKSKKKIGSIGQSIKSLDYSIVNDSGFKQLWKKFQNCKMQKFGMPQSFDFNNFISYVPFFELVD